MEEEIKNQIKLIIKQPTLEIANNDSLITSGILNSLNIVELATWMEQKYQIDFSKRVFNVYDFETVESIVTLMNKKN